MLTFIRCPSWRKVELLGTARRVRLPAAAGRAQPVELARLEAAVLAAIARQPARVTVDEVSYKFEIAPALRVRRTDDLRLQQPVQAQQGRVAPQLVAHQLVGGFRTF